MPATAATVGELLHRAAAGFAAAGIVCAHGAADCRDEAAAIIYHVLGLRHDDPSAYGRTLSDDERQRCEALLARRIVERQPAAYLLGEAWFAGLPFFVDRRVLVPRSPFAELIEARFAPWLAPLDRPRILELGTGSGCIAIACALAFPGSEVLATDISADALAVARRNVERHGTGGQVRLLQADLYTGLAGRFDLIISNPPYVPDGDLVDMPAEFAWEPHGALAGGADGLDLVRRIVGGAGAFLEPDGWLAVEVGGGSAVLEAAFPHVPFTWPEFERGGDGIALVAAGDLPGDNAPPGRGARGE